MSKKLVIVESPTKAKTIRKFLPSTFRVEASMGHIRDLPETAAAIPLKYKKEEWSKLGVDPDNGFEPIYVVPKNKTKIVSNLKKLIKEADELYLATDEDREGESISWHLTELLKPKVPVKRMVFHEITKAAIQKALEQTRSVDLKLVRAQETRRILDRLYGYTLSPLIWKKIAFGLSAGRVQSVGLRLIVDRERERLGFQKSNYWDVDASLEKSKETFKARLESHKDKRLASGKDFEEKTGKLKNPKDIVAFDEKAAKDLAKELKGAEFKVAKIDERPFTSKPSAPFITSTLQQEANRKLGMSSKEAMRTAQRLYEEGLITYMRTDSPNLSQEALKASRNEVENLYGKEFLSDGPKQYASKSKSAQEAHEAIRPAGASFVHPSKASLSGREKALYELIWMRTIASQMADAKKLSVTLKIQAKDSQFSASGTRILFPGFIRAYVEGSDDPEASLDDKEVVFPKLTVGDTLNCTNLEPLSHETKARSRFTEASLVQLLEKEGIGRPSTYASIIDTIVYRGYVRKVGNALIPTFTGFAVIQLLEEHFAELVDPSFTSKMEDTLDEIAAGEKEWLPYLKQFYSGKNGLAEQVKAKEKVIDPDKSRSIDLNLKTDIKIRVGRFGAYIEGPLEPGQKKDEALRATIPEDIAPSDIDVEQMKILFDSQKNGPTALFQHPDNGENIYCLVGRFGPYLQLGEMTDDQPKPRRASVPKGMHPDQITIEEAVKWLSLPRDLGNHPDTGKPVLTNVGRFGPYVMHDGDFRSLKKEDDVYTVELDRALELLAQEKKGRGGAKMIKELSVHPDSDKKMAIYDGKYGPYIKLGSKNFTIPEGLKVEDLTDAQAIEIINKKGGIKKKAASKKAPSKNTVAKKKVAKKKSVTKKKT
ncbi:type I DNA topoisomerase [bacterium]|nr:type I DNA topoisomerase [bacterium]